jgi:hypothetical protein
MAKAKARKKPDARQKDLARIHILAGQLGLDRESYENVLWANGRVESSKDLDEHGRRQVIAHLESRLPASQRYKGRPNNIDSLQRQELKKIEALLADAGRPWAYAVHLARTMYKREALEFCSVPQLVGILTALDKDALRRHSARMQLLWGDGWQEQAQRIAELLFGLERTHNAAANSKHLGLALGWWDGRIEACCAWPVALDGFAKPPMCCGGCYQRALRQAGRI